MDNFNHDDYTSIYDGKQASAGLAGRDVRSSSVEHLDRLKSKLGALTTQYRTLDHVLSQQQAMALGQEVGHTMGNANDTQVGGSHYQDINATGVCPHCRGEIQHWDWAGRLPGLEYAATKYLSRWRLKQPLDSLKKVLHYVQKIIEQNFPDVRVTITVESLAEVPEATRPVDGIFGTAAKVK